MNFFFLGIKEYPIGKPILKFYLEVKDGATGKTAIFFCVHHVAEVYNDEWEIKADNIFLLYDGKFYLLKSISTNYQERVTFNKTGYGFSFNSSYPDVTICFGAEGGMTQYFARQISIPKNEWKEIKLSLEIIKKPKGDYQEELKVSLVGEKFPINLNHWNNLSAKRNYEEVLISRGDVFSALQKSGKDTSGFICDDYIAFDNDCYKLL